MIEINHNGARYTFGARVNALGIVLYLAYYAKEKECFSFTDAWSKLKREDIIIPDEVATQAKLKASELTTIK